MGMAIPAPAIMQAEEPAWLYVNGGESFSDETNNYFTAWLDMPSANGVAVERVVVCRLIVPLDVARRIRDQANRAWSKGGH